MREREGAIHYHCASNIIILDFYEDEIAVPYIFVKQIFAIEHLVYLQICGIE